MAARILAACRRPSLSCHYGANMVSCDNPPTHKITRLMDAYRSLSVLGWGPGIVTMVVAGILFYITSITMWKYIMKYPQIKDICDFGYYAFGKSKIAYEFTAFMLLANNIMLIGFHILTGAKVLNTLSDHSVCTVGFSAIVTVIGVIMSLPRTLKHVSFMSMFSAAAMALAILLFLVFAGIEKPTVDAPLVGYYGDWPLDTRVGNGKVATYAVPLAGTDFVSAMGMLRYQATIREL